MGTTTTDIEAWLGARLPEPYRAFVERHADDVDASDLVLLYGRDSLIERNETHEVKEFCPGHVCIGNDSGDMEFVLPLAGGAVSMVDAGSMRAEHFHVVADDFAAWYAAGCPLPEDEHDFDEWPPLTEVCIYLERRPPDLKSLIRIKEVLGVQKSIGELKRSLDSIPCLIAEGLAYAGAKVRCAEANAVENCLGIRLATDPSVELPLE